MESSEKREPEESKIKIRITVSKNEQGYFATTNLEGKTPEFAQPGMIFYLEDEVNASTEGIKSLRDRVKQEADDRGIDSHEIFFID